VIDIYNDKDSGLTAKEAGEKHGVHPSTIYAICRRSVRADVLDVHFPLSCAKQEKD